MGNKIGNEVYVKHFNKTMKIEDVFMVGDEGRRYVYQISYQKTTYILKGFKIQVEHFDPRNRESAQIFEQNLMKMSEILQEYHFARAASLINPHVAKPLSLDLSLELAKNRSSFSYLHIQIIFEHGGVALNNLQPTTIEQTYNLMRQSANALFLLHSIGIAHFNIKSATMVYDAKKDLLKIINMGSAFGCSSREKLAATTVNLEGKIRSATLEFAPPEVLFMGRGLTRELNTELSLPAIDVYYWAMSFFALLTNRSTIDLKNYLTNYKSGLEADYKKFMEIVEACFGSVKPKNSKEAELMTVVSNLLTRALRYKPKERLTIKDAICEMKKFERKKKYTLNYLKTELEYSKELFKLFIPNDEDMNSLNELVNKNENKVEYKNQILDKSANLSVKLSCEHEVNKDHLLKYALELFIQRNPYEYNCFCKICNKIQKLKSLSLSCGCIWTMFGEKIKYNNDLTKVSYGRCDKGHPLTSIDLGFVNDFSSLEFTSLMISDYPQEKKTLVNSFNKAVEKESMEDISWILRHTKAVTKLNLSRNNIGDESAKAISEALRTNTTLTKLDLYKNKIGVEGVKAIGEMLKTNTTLKKLNLSSNDIKDEGAKAIGEALKVNITLEYLDLQCNKLETEGYELLKEVQERSKNIEIKY